MTFLFLKATAFEVWCNAHLWLYNGAEDYESRLWAGPEGRRSLDEQADWNRLSFK